MIIDLNRATFRRLVQIDLLLVGALVALAVYEALGPAWSDFSDDFDTIAAKHFGPSAYAGFEAEIAILLLLLGLALWMFASLVGLYWFKRWARFGTWASMLALFLLMWLLPGQSVGYSSRFMDILTFLDSAATGMILLLAYAKDHGQIWFSSIDTQPGD